MLTPDGWPPSANTPLTSAQLLVPPTRSSACLPPASSMRIRAGGFNRTRESGMCMKGIIGACSKSRFCASAYSFQRLSLSFSDRAACNSVRNEAGAVVLVSRQGGEQVAGLHPAGIELHVAHMDLAEPSIATAIDRCAAEGVDGVLRRDLVIGDIGRD